MSIQVLWENEEKSVLRWYFKNTWNWHEFNTARSRCHTLLDTVPHTADLIFDLRDTDHLPTGALFRSKRHLDTLHPRTGIVMIVGADRVARYIYDTLGKIYPRLKAKYMMGFADTLEGAYATIDAVQAGRVQHV